MSSRKKRKSKKKCQPEPKWTGTTDMVIEDLFVKDDDYRGESIIFKFKKPETGWKGIPKSLGIHSWIPDKYNHNKFVVFEVFDFDSLLERAHEFIGKRMTISFDGDYITPVWVHDS